MKAVFVDRDGVINKAFVRQGRPFPPTNLSEVEILPLVPLALDNLRLRGFKIIVITNQPDVARGVTSVSDVEKINSYLLKHLAIDEIFCCYHDDSDNCSCRKPKPGAIIHAAKKYGIQCSSSFMVGDRWRDVEAGHLAGCRTIFLDYGYSERQPLTFDYRVESLFQASEIILGENSE